MGLTTPILNVETSMLTSSNTAMDCARKVSVNTEWSFEKVQLLERPVADATISSASLTQHESDVLAPSDLGALS